MAPSNPKRPPRRPPPEDGTKDSEDTGELPFDEREATPLNADDPAPQRVTTYPVRPGRKRRAGRDTIGPASMVSTVAGAGNQEIFLYAEHGPGTGQLLPVGEGALILGRSSSCDLRLPHASISRRHARLTRRGERLFLEDLGSQNGTFLDDERLAGPCELLVGQRIHIGPAVLRLRVPGGHTRTDRPRRRPGAQEREVTLRPLRLAVLAATAGFLLATALALWTAQTHPGWLRLSRPAAHAPAR
ncbi:MAG TPA: FHA domain-containing protein [Myxococcaceae bacterium]|nr:FHA domain-containing protein [Myxococcaceae bacterium]